MFTCNTASGSSVVDYCVVPTEHFDKVRDFSITQMDAIVNDLMLEDLVRPGAALPDHELLTVEITGSGQYVEDFVKGLGALNYQQNRRKRIPRKFKSEYMNNARVKIARVYQ